jgi:hypothetical protein
MAMTLVSRNRTPELQPSKQLAALALHQVR